ncbi:MAG: GNAT family N-acetyltransferase [Desulfobacterales bacterium]|nr:GNAT family N-acetyltransferase [Desulfobacterales bacterium]
MVDFYFLEKSEFDYNQLSQILEIYKEQGWWKGNSSDLEFLFKLIKGSYCFLIAIKDKKIIGMGRVISDGVSDAYIQDVAVKKEYRGQAIGTNIVKTITTRLNDNGIRWIGLISVKESQHIYKNNGFQIMKGFVPMLKLNV